MDNLISVINEMTVEDSLWFLSTCLSQGRNLFGVPRVIVYNSRDINIEDLDLLFDENLSYIDIDKAYIKYINEDMVSSALEYTNTNNIKIVFDVCRYDFTQRDELFEHLGSDLRKLFNLKLRHEDRNKFYFSNKQYFSSSEYVLDTVVKSKLNDIWFDRWGGASSYKVQDV